MADVGVRRWGADSSPLPRSLADHGPSLLLAAVPALAMVYLAFESGGYSPAPTGAVTLGLLLLFAGRTVLVAKPGEGINRTVLVAVGALGCFAIWILLSSGWSHAPGPALIEFDRALLYVAALWVFGTVGMDSRRLRWIVRGLAVAAVFVCTAGLMTRLLPGVWPPPEGVLDARLSYPVEYWNTFALLAAVGITLCFGLTSDQRESRLVRVLAAAAIPLLASGLLLTLSRGGIAVAAVGVLAAAVIAHSRGLLAGALAVVPPTALTVWKSYGASDLLASDKFLTAAAHAEGHRLAVIVGLSALVAGAARGLLLPADDWAQRLRLTTAVRRGVLGALAATLVGGLIAAAIAVDVRGQYDSFVESTPAASTVTGSARLTDITNNGRIKLWDVALDEFKRDPVNGSGAGTYDRTYLMHRDSALRVVDAHSLYAEVLSELGIVGMGLLLIALLTILFGVARRVSGPDRTLYATVFAAIAAWCVAAGADWHWEMPVVTMWVFALGGAAIAGARDRTPATRFLGLLPRWTLAIVACVLVALVPLRLIFSQTRLDAATDAYTQNMCSDASVLADQSLDAVGSRWEPRELIAGCEMESGGRDAAISTLREAARRDPNAWRVHYALAVVQARSGDDPSREIRRALQLNPQEPLVQETAKGLARARNAQEWRAAARRMDLNIPVPKI